MRRLSALAVSCVLFVVSVVLLVLLMREMNIKKATDVDAGKKPVTATETKKPETAEERMSYAYGVVTYRQLADKGYPLNLKQFKAGLETAASGGEVLLSDEEIQQVFEEAEKSQLEKQAR